MTKSFPSQFKLINTFFINLEFKRDPAIAPGVEMQFEIQLKIAELDFPKFQLNMLNITRSGSPIKMSIESVGIFEYQGEKTDKYHDLLNDFVKDEGLPLLWPYTALMIRIITGQMGMDPLRIPVQIYFESTKKTETDKVEIEK